jgi:hypothetical protein
VVVEVFSGGAGQVEFRGVRAGPDGLSEVEDGRLMVFIPWAEIRRVELVHGRVAERPVVQVIIGAALIAVACWPLLHLAYWALHGGMFLRAEAWLVAAGGVGAYMIWHALRSGWYVEVEAASGTRKLVFHGNVVEGEAQVFVQAVRERVGTKDSIR